MASYSLDILKVGQTEVPGCEIYWMDKLFEWEPLYFLIGVARGHGRTILINTGPPLDYGDLNKHWMAWQERHELVVADDERPKAALAKIGVEPEEVSHILITPLTAYTTGNIDLFPNAEICLSKRGWADFHIPDPVVPQLPRHIYMPRNILVHLVTDAWPRVRLLEDETEEIVPGVRSFFVGGHHRSTMAFVIDTPKGRVCLSDVFFKYPNFEQNRPLGISESLEEHYHAYDRIRKEADLIVPLYDPAVFDRHPNGKVA